MSLKDDISNAVNSILDNEMSITETSTVPDINDTSLTFGLIGKRFRSVSMYIDLRGSTAILEKHNSNVVIKIHKAYFITIVKIVRNRGGEVRSFNGDSLLAFFPGDDSVTIENAVRVAMELKYMLLVDANSLKSKVVNKYNTNIDIGIGLDIGSTTVAKVGMSNYNNQDLIWIGANVNRAVKISDVRSSGENIGISKRLYDRLTNNVKFHENTNMWRGENYTYNGSGELQYKTSYYWTLG